MSVKRLPGSLLHLSVRNNLAMPAVSIQRLSIPGKGGISNLGIFELVSS